MYKVILIIDYEGNQALCIPVEDNTAFTVYKETGQESSHSISVSKHYSRFTIYECEHECEDEGYDYYNEVEMPIDGEWHDIQGDVDTPDISWFNMFSGIFAIDYRDIYKKHIRLASSCTSS